MKRHNITNVMKSLICRDATAKVIFAHAVGGLFSLNLYFIFIVFLWLCFSGYFFSDELSNSLDKETLSLSFIFSEFT